MCEPPMGGASTSVCAACARALGGEGKTPPCGRKATLPAAVILHL